MHKVIDYAVSPRPARGNVQVSRAASNHRTLKGQYHHCQQKHSGLASL